MLRTEGNGYDISRGQNIHIRAFYTAPLFPRLAPHPPSSRYVDYRTPRHTRARLSHALPHAAHALTCCNIPATDARYGRAWRARRTWRAAFQPSRHARISTSMVWLLFGGIHERRASTFAACASSPWRHACLSCVGRHRVSAWHGSPSR